MMRLSRVFLFFFAALCVSCYRMPEEGEVSIIPDTNNPSIIRNQGSTGMPTTPGVNF